MILSSNTNIQFIRSMYKREIQAVFVPLHAQMPKSLLDTLRRTARRKLHSTLGLALLFFCGLSSLKAQGYSIILGRPTDVSVTASVLFDQNVEFYFEYGTQSGNYPSNTATFTNVADTPDEIDLQNLFIDTKYYYRMQYRLAGAGSYTASPEYSFHTQRAPGSTFTFTLEADEHLYDKKGVLNLYNICLANQALDQPDFMMSLGDIFGDDHHPDTISSAALNYLHRYYRPYLGNLCHSVPFYICLGNHEGENDFYMAQTPPNNLAINGTLWRKFYYPNPFPNAFYSGNTDVEPYGVGNPENYYAWTWGEALFVVLDAYRDENDTTPKPKRWDWSLGLPQYTWLKNTLQNSTARYKFVFAHHTRGQDRGGILTAPYFEWGGYEANGTVWGFDNERPGWGGKPIHQLFRDYGVNIFFQGHDHLFAHEVLDSIVYQEVPMPSDSTYEIGMLANADAYVSDTIGGSGHLRVTVTPTCITVDFVRAYLPADTVGGLHHNREVAFSYTLGNCGAVGVQPSLPDNPTLMAYPNPAKDLLTVESKSPTMQDSRIELISLQGQVVQTQVMPQGGRICQFDLRGTTAGVYAVRWVGEQHRSAIKVVLLD